MSDFSSMSDGSDCRQISACGVGGDGTHRTLALGIILGMVALIVGCCLWYCCRKEKVASSQENPDYYSRPSIVKIQESLPSNRNLKEMCNVQKAALRKKIRETLVTKKAVETKTLNNNDDEENKKTNSMLKRLSSSNRVYSSYASAFIKSKSSSLEFVEDISTQKSQEEIMESGAINATATTSDEKEETVVGEVENVSSDLNSISTDTVNTTATSTERRRSSALARSISMRIQGRRSSAGNNNNNNKCFLCLLEYEVGESVSSSPNPDCHDTFHTDCIVAWLMKRDQCPCCRQPMLLLPDKEVAAAAATTTEP